LQLIQNTKTKISQVRNPQHTNIEGKVIFGTAVNLNFWSELGLRKNTINTPKDKNFFRLTLFLCPIYGKIIRME
jgi:hypothetical protein